MWGHIAADICLNIWWKNRRYTFKKDLKMLYYSIFVFGSALHHSNISEAIAQWWTTSRKDCCIPLTNGIGFFGIPKSYNCHFSQLEQVKNQQLTSLNNQKIWAPLPNDTNDNHSWSCAKTKIPSHVETWGQKKKKRTAIVNIINWRYQKCSIFAQAEGITSCSFVPTIFLS